MRTVLFHNIVAPYRHCLFRELGQRLDLVVWYAAGGARDRLWDSTLTGDYAAEFMESTTIHAFNRPFTVCKHISGRLERHDPHTVISVLTRSNIVDILRIGQWCRRKGRRFVLWVGDTCRRKGSDPVPAPIRLAYRLVFQRALGLADAFISYSEASDRWLHEQGQNKVTVTGTQVLDAPAEPPRLYCDGRPAKVQLLFVGKHEPRKGLHELVAAIGSLPPTLRERVELLTVGNGELVDWLARESRAKFTHRPLGHVPRERLWPIYKAADLLVLPSVHDPWGLVTNEAMSMGTPVLASLYCGSAELARQAGWVMDVGNADEFSASLSRAIEGCRSTSLRAQAVAAESAYRPGPAAVRIANFLMDGP